MFLKATRYRYVRVLSSLFASKVAFRTENVKKGTQNAKKDYNIWTMEGGDDIPTTYLFDK